VPVVGASADSAPSQYGTSRTANGRTMAADISTIRGHVCRRIAIQAAIPTVMLTAIAAACRSPRASQASGHSGASAIMPTTMATTISR